LTPFLYLFISENTREEKKGIMVTEGTRSERPAGREKVFRRTRGKKKGRRGLATKDFVGLKGGPGNTKRKIRKAPRFGAGTGPKARWEGDRGEEIRRGNKL